MVVTADNAAAIFDIGFPIARRYEDDTIDDVSLARTLATARLDRHDQRFEEFIADDDTGRGEAAASWGGSDVDLPSGRASVACRSARGVRQREAGARRVRTFTRWC